MENLTVKYRDREDKLPVISSALPIVSLLPDERIRRIRNHEKLCSLLAVLRPDVDPDLWTRATYGELIAFATEALQAERLRIGSHVTPPPIA